MAVQIGARPDSGFDDPLGMLKDCHRRIENFLAILCHVSEREREGALRGEEKSAVESALHYFRVGGRRHTADEEDSLFPRLKSAGADLDTLNHLEADHRDADQLHATVERLFSEWIAAGTIGSEDRQTLRSATEGLKNLYAGHIEVEEKRVFPQAAKVLDGTAIQEMGAEFRVRRNT